MISSFSYRSSTYCAQQFRHWGEWDGGQWGLNIPQVLSLTTLLSTNRRNLTCYIIQIYHSSIYVLRIIEQAFVIRAITHPPSFCFNWMTLLFRLLRLASRTMPKSDTNECTDLLSWGMVLSMRLTLWERRLEPAALLSLNPLSADIAVATELSKSVWTCVHRLGAIWNTYQRWVESANGNYWGYWLSLPLFAAVWTLHHTPIVFQTLDQQPYIVKDIIHARAKKLAKSSFHKRVF